MRRGAAGYKPIGQANLYRLSAPCSYCEERGRTPRGAGTGGDSASTNNALNNGYRLKYRLNVSAPRGASESEESAQRRPWVDAVSRPRRLSRTKRGLAERGRRGFPAECGGLAAKPSPCTIELSESPPLSDGWPLAAYPCAGRRGSQPRSALPPPRRRQVRSELSYASPLLKGFAERNWKDLPLAFWGTRASRFLPCSPLRSRPPSVAFLRAQSSENLSTLDIRAGGWVGHAYGRRPVAGCGVPSHGGPSVGVPPFSVPCVPSCSRPPQGGRPIARR